jgi:myo-inositol-1-phosphate synthase
MVRAMAEPRFGVADSSAAAAVERLAADIASFRRRARLDDVVVVHVASSEPPARRHSAHARYATLQKAMARRAPDVIPASSVYALAAVESGAAYVNFTPSTGIRLPAIRERADARGIPYMDRDGKTGETLVKSVLAPMFAWRNLRVLSWFGQNILGNRDGAVLADPKTRRSKIASKEGVVGQILDGRPVTHVGIDYVPSLHDWKVAWDFVHFEGFLETRMSMQFVWQGADSVLAAPLVIDLARLSALELRRGRGGPMRHLACFFKDPLDVEERDLFSQWRRLIDHVQSLAVGF